MAVSDILEKALRYKCNLVEITGGEPLIQKDTPALVQHLIDHDCTVMLETNGTIDTCDIDQRCMKIIDIKCPSSNESGKNNFINFKRLSNKDQIKFVIGTRDDYEFAKNIIREYNPELPDGHILFSSVFNKMPLAMISEWILEDNLNVRLQMQMHKFIWPEKDRGV